MRLELLQWMVAQSAPQVSAQYPLGYCQVTQDLKKGAEELASEGYVTAYPTSAGPDGRFPVVVTEAGMKAAQQPAPMANVGNPHPPEVQQQPKPTYTANVKIEDNIPVPEGRKRGFQASEGGTVVDRYGFVNMLVGQSFHLPPSGDPEKPIHRTFSNVVSQANAKLWPRHFLVREVGNDDPAGAGARVWRGKDMEGEKPAPKARKQKAAAVAPQGYPAPQGQAFSAPGGFGAPGGFQPPQAPQGGFGAPAPLQGYPAPGAFGGFPENFPAPGQGQGFGEG